MHLSSVRSYRIFLTVLFAAGLVVGFGESLNAQTLHVKMEGVRASEGTIRLGFYDSKAQWKTEKSSFQRAAPKAGLVDGVLEFLISDVSPGEYAVAIADDENDNGEIDWGWILPKEGFGFSNYELKGIRRPQYDDFKFELSPEGVTTIVVKVRYL